LPTLSETASTHNYSTTASFFNVINHKIEHRLFFQKVFRHAWGKNLRVYIKHVVGPTYQLKYTAVHHDDDDTIHLKTFSFWPMVG